MDRKQARARQQRPLSPAFSPAFSPALIRRTLVCAMARAMLGGTLAVAPAAVLAQEAPAAARGYDIPAGPLEDALNRFGRESGTLLSFPTELTAGLRTPGLHGRYPVQAGLDALLAGSGLRAVRLENGSYTLQRVPRPTATGDAVLPVVKVQGTAFADGVTEGSGSYTAASASTATKLDLSLRETPQSITVVTRQQIDDQRLTNVANVLERSTGITLNRLEHDRIYLYARGFEITKIQYDGIPNVDNYGYDTDLMADTAIYDRVEIVRGATGLLSGTGEPSAAVNLVRKRPTREFQGHALLSAGSWDAYRGEVDLSGALTEAGNVRGRFVGSYGESRSYLDAYRKDATGVYGIVEVDLPGDTLLTLGLDYQESRTDGVLYGAPVPLFHADGSRTHFSRSSTSGADWTSLDKERTVGFASLEKQFANGWKASLHYTYRDGDASPRLMYMYGFPDRATGQGVSTFFSSYDIEHRQNAVDVHASGPFSLFGREHELVLGYSHNQRELSHKWYPVVSSVPLDSYYDRDAYPAPQFGANYNRSLKEERREEAVYLASRWQLADPLKFILGVRVTNADYEQVYLGARTSASYKGEATPYAGVVFDINESYSAYLSYTDIFQTQTSRDRNNALLDPRTGTNYEAGVKAEFQGGRFNLSAAVFRVEQDNLAEFDTVIDGQNRYRAIEGATVRGFEVEASGELVPGWNLAGGFTRRIAKAGDGSSIQTTEPQNLLRLTSSHRLGGALERFTVGGHVTWQSRTYEKGVGPAGEDAEQKPYALLHLFGSYRVNRALSFQLNINNLFDRVYYSGLSEGYGHYGDPRNATLSMKYQF